MRLCWHLEALLEGDERLRLQREPRHAAERFAPPLKLVLTEVQTAGCTVIILCEEHTNSEVGWGTGPRPDASDALRVAAGLPPRRRWWEWYV